MAGLQLERNQLADMLEDQIAQHNKYVNDMSKEQTVASEKTDKMIEEKQRLTQQLEMEKEKIQEQMDVLLKENRLHQTEKEVSKHEMERMTHEVGRRPYIFMTNFSHISISCIKENNSLVH